MIQGIAVGNIPAFSAAERPEAEQKQYKRCGDQRNDQQRIHLHRIRGNADSAFHHGINAAGAQEESVGIDTIGCAGHESHDIPAGEDRQLFHLMGEHDKDLFDLIGEHLVEHGNGKGITDNELVEVSKESCGGESSVCGEDAVGICAADGEGRTFEVSDRDIEDGVAGAVVDGQLHIDLRNGDIAHDSGAGDIECGIIAADIIVIDERRIDNEQAFVIVICACEEFFIVAVVDLGQSFAVACDGAALDFGVPPVADGRIEHHGEAHQK